MLDPVFLFEAGWDAARRLLQPPQGDRLLGWPCCSVPGCTVETPGLLCTGCIVRQRNSGMTVEDFLAAAPSKQRADAWLVDERLCLVDGCQRPIHVRTTGLCNSHSHQCRGLFDRAHPDVVPAFLARPDVRPHPTWGPCLVPACLRVAYASAGLCVRHGQRWGEALRAGADIDLGLWCRRQDGITVSGVANLRGLAHLVVIELLAGLQLRTGRGAKTRPSQLNRLARIARHQEVERLSDIDVSQCGSDLATILSGFVRDASRATTTAVEEQRKDLWDLAILGGAGRLDFTVLEQPWLREIGKHWASEDLPRRRGDKAGMVVRTHLGSLAALSTSLRLNRPDRGMDRTSLGRSDIVAFLARLAHLEKTGALTPKRRVQMVRHVRTVLRDCRDLGMTRPGGCVAGLPGEFSLRSNDVPQESPIAGPGRSLPNEVMKALSEALPVLEGLSGRAARVAVEVLMDTGRRPDEVCQLPWDCLDRDSDGKYVLIYTDYKENRLKRRVPIADATAALIRGQQALVQAMFTHTSTAELVLFPAATTNPNGTSSLRAVVLTGLHREWVNRLDEFTLSDGGVFPATAVVAYAYRHTYAQRHADAGTPIDVLRELMGHRSVHSTEAYYNPRELQQMGEIQRIAC
ncbi:tyrosine-type recombinase/integrase [Kribbella caucasensis]|uniref:tyrosine-type recombinase/integrase n=1 Tax=Kribbella caucasensis TaxID=2512215 RepID=UPI001414EF0D|nr:site-specific integrase [Kribbella sp. VKM Ac-2527]